MAEMFENRHGRIIVENLIEVITENRAYLSDLDGAIGDGDHGINMAKGFALAGERLAMNMNFSQSLKILGSVLMMEIGGSMGPLYGKFFRSMAKECLDSDNVDAATFSRMLRGGYDAIQAIGGAKPGDKTMVDTLDPAITAFDDALENGKGFSASLADMRTAAELGRDSTIEMIAKLGRAARLGERSKGVLDAGATSCCLILESMALSINRILEKN
jgi:phosphoenolpyruvate---glycerone phosphotransferase subunit DhaL